MPKQMTVMLADPEHPAFAFSMPPEASFSQWKEQGMQFVLAGRMLNWLIGDWVIAGVERFGEKARDHANAIFRRDVDRLAPIVETCRAFPEPKRRQSLSFSHHQIAAKAPDPNTALDDAEQHGLTCAALRAQIKIAAPAFRLEDDDPDDTAMRQIVYAWNLAPRAARESFFALAENSDMGVIKL